MSIGSEPTGGDCFRDLPVAGGMEYGGPCQGAMARWNSAYSPPASRAENSAIATSRPSSGNERDVAGSGLPRDPPPYQEGGQRLLI